MTPEELAGAKDFENWMIEEEKRMKNSTGIFIEEKTSKRTVGVLTPIKKFEFKRPGQLSLF